MLSTKSKYIVYLIALHLVLGVLAYFAVGKGIALLGVELLILLSGLLAFRIYRDLVAPLNLLSRGVGAMQDQDFSVKMSPTGSPEMDRLGGLYNQMVDRLRKERVASRRREEFLDQLLNAAEVGIVILDLDGNVQTRNPWMKHLAQTVPDLEDTVLRPALALVPGSKQIFTTASNRRLHAEYATFVDRGFDRGFLIVQDVTADLLAAEKDAYGKVIRMMAHEVNNSNAAIISLLQTLLDASRESDPTVGELATEFLPAVINRADNMTGFMRNFARVIRLPNPAPARTDLNDLLRQSGEIMQGILQDSAIHLTYDLAPHPVIARADRSQLEQVIINAITNARESIGQGGTIVLSTTRDPAQFIIADNGPGIPEAYRDKIFTPFFSSKSKGQGVGLTLTRDILEAHRAHYQLRTEEDGWTRLRVRF